MVSIKALIDKIVAKFVDEEQLINSPLTLREINIMKKVLLSKLKNIYHLRIEYPE